MMLGQLATHMKKNKLGFCTAYHIQKSIIGRLCIIQWVKAKKEK